MNPRARLRPLGAGDLLDEAIWLYRKNFLRFVLIAAILRVPFFALSLFLNDPFRLRGLGPMLSIGIDHLLFGNLLAAAVALAVANWMDDQPLADGSLYRRTLSKIVYLVINYLTVVGAYGMFTVGVMLAVIGTTFVTAQLNLSGGFNPLSSFAEVMLFALLAVALGGIPALYLAARWSVSLQVIALENRSPLGALRRSIALMRGQYRRVMVVIAASVLLSLLLSTGPAYVSQMLADVLSPAYRRNFALDPISLIFGFAIPTLLDLLISPIGFIARALLYYDLRVRQEGYDLVRRASQLAEQGA